MSYLNHNHPRPDFIREKWADLNGSWEFSFDIPSFDRRIEVPFCYQCRASGIADPSEHNAVWYRRRFSAEKNTGTRLLLHFGAVDYRAQVWVNGIYLGEHKGGHSPFHFDITDAAVQGDNEITVCVEDYPETDKPRGKQSWTGENFGCFYTPTTGIWQSVWLEYAAELYLKRVKITPDVEKLQALCEVFLSKPEKAEIALSASIDREGKTEWLGENTICCKNGYGKAVFAFEDLDIRRKQLVWEPEHPNLIEVTVTVKNPVIDDVVHTYFGLRDIRVENGVVLLNQVPFYQRLILDQGYWPQTLLTPPDEEAIQKDILLAKSMGFNGARKHQKIEDPRYYYWADRLGFLVWGELPSAYCFNDNAMENSIRELTEFVERDYNHPSVIAWVPVNESWGVRGVQANRQQQAYVRTLYYLLKALDPARLVSANDGWEQVSETDICAVHDYALSAETADKYNDLERTLGTYSESRMLFAEGNAYRGQPILITEFGGISFADDSKKGWGYYKSAESREEFLARLGPVLRYLKKSRKFSGYCYTQLTDVMQEVNGLLTEDREPKVPLEQLKAIFAGQ